MRQVPLSVVSPKRDPFLVRVCVHKRINIAQMRCAFFNRLNDRSTAYLVKHARQDWIFRGLSYMNRLFRYEIESGGDVDYRGLLILNE